MVGLIFSVAGRDLLLASRSLSTCHPQPAEGWDDAMPTNSRGC
jgi:hypothetical protein